MKEEIYFNLVIQRFDIKLVLKHKAKKRPR